MVLIAKKQPKMIPKLQKNKASLIYEDYDDN